VAIGAASDGKKDNTEAFTAAMKAAAETGNGAVFVPRGRYLFKGNLVVPEGVMLEGVIRAAAG
jgi:polygalacturonase